MPPHWAATPAGRTGSGGWRVEARSQGPRDPRKGWEGVRPGLLGSRCDSPASRGDFGMLGVCGARGGGVLGEARVPPPGRRPRSSCPSGRPGRTRSPPWSPRPDAPAVAMTTGARAIGEGWDPPANERRHVLGAGRAGRWGRGDSKQQASGCQMLPGEKLNFYLSFSFQVLNGKCSERRASLSC